MLSSLRNYRDLGEMTLILGSYLMSGPPDIDIRDISFKLRNITCVSQSFSRFYVGFGLQSCVWWGEPVGLTKMHV